MILIADSGGTKVEWCLLDSDKVMARFSCPGMNAMMLTAGEMSDRLGRELMPEIAKWSSDITDVFFYGAGCVSPGVCQGVADAILSHIPQAKVEVSTDLLGAAHALCGDSPGIACILGTGSNSCYYDGQRIAENVSPLGFILGDEGSGAYLGKMLVGDVLKHQLPEGICKAFADETGLDAVTIIQRVYREPYPNRFLASLTPFLSKHIGDKAVHDLVVNAFKAFFKRNVCQYAASKSYKVSFTGSIAHYFKDQLIEASSCYGLQIGDIIRTPMDGLIRYHS